MPPHGLRLHPPAKPCTASLSHCQPSSPRRLHSSPACTLAAAACRTRARSLYFLPGPPAWPASAAQWARADRSVLQPGRTHLPACPASAACAPLFSTHPNPHPHQWTPCLAPAQRQAAAACRPARRIPACAPSVPAPSDACARARPLLIRFYTGLNVRPWLALELRQSREATHMRPAGGGGIESGDR